ncbi:MAG: hypothetical protein ABI411_21345 [Tahibacter sp.]
MFPLAEAAIFTVGTGAGCSHATIQSALNAAEASPGADTVRLTRSLTYSAQANTINTSQNLNLVGGFATCSQIDTDNIKTGVSGAGGATEPVFRITANTGSIIKLRHLTINNGDEDGTGKGGGIYFRGDGVLEVIETTITGNTAGSGGGIYAEGTGTNAELILSADVLVTNNTARYSGGGVVAEGLEMTMIAPGSLIAFNEATGTLNGQTGQTIGGYGGGLLVLGGGLASYAYVGSPGPGTFGPIYSNEARYGGGVAVVSDEAFARLNLFSTSAAQRTSINQNFASVSGGGLYVWSDDRGGFVIGAFAQAVLWNADIIGNAAPKGSAAHIAETPGLLPVGYAGLSINLGTAPADAINCPTNAPCTRIAGNQDQDTTGQATNGAVLLVEENDYLHMNRTELSGNRGSEVLRALGSDTDISALNTFWSGNSTSNPLIRTNDDVDLSLESSTIAGNTIGASQVISADGDFYLQRSILWQPGKTSLSHSGGSKSVENVLTSERISLDGGNTPYVLEDAPRFVDPARSDYRLRAASQAVDFASTGAGEDLLGLERAVDLPFKYNRMGTADLGAFERQTLAPLVLNSDFDGDLNLWPEILAAASTWTNAQNASGAAGSGSTFVSLTNIPQTRIYARAQCIHLPGPGRYLLNGWGRTGNTSTFTSDSAILYWELRRNGTEDCNAGPPDATGNHFLAKGPWARPANPAVIDILAQDWTYTSSITVFLAVNDNGITFPATATGWFDGITLEVESGDKIFFDGFE